MTWRVDHMVMRIELDPQRVVVRNTLHVQHSGGTDEPLVLDGRGLELLEVLVGGRALHTDEYELTDRTLSLHPARLAGSDGDGPVPDGPIGDGRFVVTTTVTVVPGGANASGVTARPELLSTNCEPHGFRRISYAIDHPANRSTFDVTLVGDPARFPAMLSNGDLVDHGLLDDGRAWARFVDPVSKPTYLFAFVAGDLRTISRPFTTRSGRTIDLRIAALADQIDGADFALATMAEVMSFDEAHGGLEHDLDVLTFVAIPGYPDATEYQGLMFFDPAVLVVDTRGYVDDDLLLIIANVSHEYGHHTRGNRVTVKSWGQLALKEGLTVLTAQNDVRRHWFGPVGRVLDVVDLRRLQFPEEVTIGAPVVRGEVDDPTQLYNRTTYLKGAEVFGMIRTLLGTDEWQRVFGEFLSRFDLGSAGVDDFIAVAVELAPQHAEAITGIARWFSLRGRPALRVTATPGEAGMIVEIERTDALADDPHVSMPIAVALRTLDGRLVTAERVLVLDGRTGRWVVPIDEASAGGPDGGTDGTAAGIDPTQLVMSPLRGYSAPVDFSFAMTPEQLASLLVHDDDAFARWWASEELMIGAIDAHRGGRLDEAAAFVEILTTALRTVIGSDVEPMLLAQLLALPDEFMLGDREQMIDIDGVSNGLTHLRSALGRALHDELIELLDASPAEAAGDDSARQIAERTLVEPVLALVLATGSEVAHAAARRQLASPNATRSIRALTQLAHLDDVAIDELISETYARIEHAPKLVDRWLRAQSGARRSDTIERVGRLAGSSLYNRADRARVMGIWFPFATRNRSVFHTASGDGYRLFVDELMVLMPVNAGLAVRLVGDLLQFQRFDPHRRALLRGELERLAGAPGMPDFAVGIIRSLLA